MKQIVAIALLASLTACAAQPVATPVTIDTSSNQASVGAPPPAPAGSLGLLQQALNDAAPDLAASYNLAANAQPEDKIGEACFKSGIDLNNSFKANAPAPDNLGKLHLFYDVESARLNIIKLNQDTLVMTAVLNCGRWIQDTRAQGIQIPAKFRDIFILMAGALLPIP